MAPLMRRMEHNYMVGVELPLGVAKLIKYTSLRLAAIPFLSLTYIYPLDAY